VCYSLWYNAPTMLPVGGSSETPVLYRGHTVPKVKDSSCRINLKVSVSEPQTTLRTLVLGPGETAVLPDLQFLVHSGPSINYSFFFLLTQCCF
jgi:hypothetical protein